MEEWKFKLAYATLHSIKINSNQINFIKLNLEINFLMTKYHAQDC